jgi:hypothetical protein
MMFDSLNPYDSLAVVVSDSPQALVADLKKIATPIRIVAIVQAGTKSVAYIMGDVRVDATKKNSKTKKEI